MAEEFNTDSTLSTFLHESNRKLKKLNNIILKNQNADCFDDADINAVFRIMHTIKGLSDVLMYENIANAAHRLEDVFYYLRETHSGHVMHRKLVAKVVAISDFIKGELSKIENGDTPDGDESEVVNELAQFFNEFKEVVNSQERNMPDEDKDEMPAQFYITSLAEEDSHFYKIVIYYGSDIVMSNIRAYSVTYALEKIALDLIYTPEDLLSDDSSSDVILADGFYILIQTRATREELMSLIDNSDSERIDFDEISAAEYRKCLTELGREEELIVVMSDDEYNQEDEQDPIVPGDYVIRTKDEGKTKTSEKNWSKQQPGIGLDYEKMDSLVELVDKLVVAKDAVLQNSDLKVQGLDLSNFQKASEQLSSIIADLQEAVALMRMTWPTDVFQKKE
ncbi:MAG: Hpt domain-containing protein [Lachnospiraceae bacterium]|nr:Hpt domain-containing protein [Lachnospiraceae bacterium]